MPLLPLDHRLTTNFYYSEVVKSATAEARGFDNNPGIAELLNCQRMATLVLQPLRNKLERSISPTSWYRCEALNTAIGGSKTSSHMKGLAVDIQIKGYSPKKIAKIIMHLETPFSQLICERFESKQRPGTFVEWVHVSIAPAGEKPKYETLVASGDREGPTYNRMSIV